MGMFDDLVPKTQSGGMFDDLVPGQDNVRLHARAAGRMKEVEPTYETFGDAALGSAKAAGIGLVQGGLALGTLPGNIEALGRAGINSAAGLFGAGPVVDPDTALINYNDAKTRFEGRVGEFYEPKTTFEKFLRTGGEFAPAAFMGPAASAGGRAAQVAGPAVASETAGQLTEGTSYEPYARLAGALGGGVATNAAARTITPIPKRDPVLNKAVQTLEKEGVTALTAGQRTGSSTLRWLEDASNRFPGGGKRGELMGEKAAEQFTAAVLKRAGINGTHATQTVVDDAFNQLGTEFTKRATAAQVVADRMFPRRLQDIVKTYHDNSSVAMRVPLVENISKEIARLTTQPGGMSGKQYGGFRSQLQRAARGMQDPQAKDAISRIVEALDVQMVRTAPRGMRGHVASYLRNLNDQYRSLLAIARAVEGGGEQGARGLITPAQLKIALKSQSRRGYARGRRHLDRLANAGEAVMKPLPSSGTAERTLSQRILEAPASAYGVGALAATGGDVMSAVAATAVPWAIKSATARGVTNPTVQRYLQNQMLTGGVTPEQSRHMNALMTPWLMTREDY